jgi:hypothetical protein
MSLIILVNELHGTSTEFTLKHVNTNKAVDAIQLVTNVSTPTTDQFKPVKFLRPFHFPCTQIGIRASNMGKRGTTNKEVRLVSKSSYDKWIPKNCLPQCDWRNF